MIDPKELRIGNWATIDNPMAWPEMAGIPVLVTSVEEGFDEQFPESKGTVRMKNGHDDYNQFSEFISPIPLTPEWLERFKFVGRDDFRWRGILGIQIKNGKYYLALKDLGNVIFHSVVELKYVHTLQNAAFALTGEEL